MEIDPYSHTVNYGDKRCDQSHESYGAVRSCDAAILSDMKFSPHVYLAILMCAYLATLKFRDFAKILYFESF